jgi:pyruvate dehydrogenase E1 component beta subunit
MREISYVQAIYEALREEMQRDARVFLMGEDVQLSVYGATKGLYKEFGPGRVRNTPITEQAVVGAALGASLAGIRPVVDLMQGNFMYVAMDQFANQAAKARYMFGEQTCFPVVYMAATGAFGSAGAQHSDSPHPMFMNVGGLKIVIPATPYDAKGLLRAAIRDDNPVLYLTPVALLSGDKGPVPEEEYLVPLGQAEVKRSGKDVTIVAIGAMVRQAVAAAEKLVSQGIEAEVVDPRSVAPMDWETIFQSVRKTGRLVAVDEARRTCGATSEIAARVGEDCFGRLRSPIKILAVPDVPIPFSPVLESAVVPDAGRIADAVCSCM